MVASLETRIAKLEADTPGQVTVVYLYEGECGEDVETHEEALAHAGFEESPGGLVVFLRRWEHRGPDSPATPKDEAWQ